MAYQKNTLHALSSCEQWASGVLQQVNIEYHEQEARERQGTLPKVLLAYSTTPKTSTGEITYSLVNGTDAVIPVDIEEPSLRYSHESGPRNDESRRQDLHEAEEKRDMAYIRMVAQKQQAERYYNKKAKIRLLKVGDYVLKAKTHASKDPRDGKLGTNWDGPYKITAEASKGSFQLETMEGKLLPSNWNTAHLKYLNF
ncbi:uncharacterized protein LOC142177422 [Nicotiana tabacum]|uniref:Uncharacterized protein LOC142177422 n=1 Tax=Nicotiana tabacum TaxID=4097 RepID=A0AC58TXS5_TOBAC